MKPIVFAFALFLCVSTSLRANEPAPTPVDPALDKKINGLIQQLGDADWRTRENATTELKGIGKPALSKLQEALASKDLEIQTRAQKLIQTINAPPAPAPQPGQPVAAVNGIGGGNVIMLNGGGIVLGGAVQGMGGMGGGIAAQLQQLTQVMNNRNAQIEAILNEAMGGPAAPAVAQPQMQLPPPEAVPAALEAIGVKLGETGDGLRVMEVKPNSAAANAGVAPGDLLVKINNTAVERNADAATALGKSGNKAQLEVRRKGETITLAVTLAPTAK